MRSLLLLCCVFLLVCLRYLWYWQAYQPYQDGEHIQFTTTLFVDPDNDGAWQKISLQPSNRQVLFLTLPAYPKLAYGDTVTFRGNVRVTPIENGKNTLAFLANPEITIQKDPSFLSLPLDTITAFRSHILSLFAQTLPPISASLLLGIVFGIKSHMPKEFFAELQSVGLLHVIAASGMNVAMTAGFCASVFAYFFSRRTALAVSIVGILFYAVIAGLSPSIVRATLMGMCLFLASILGRQYLAYFALVFSALLMLLYDPAVLHDVGFQLSFAATSGILALSPLLQRLSLFLKPVFIGEDIVTTISAQISTLPILLLAFGVYPLTSILVNALVLWTIPLIMMLGGLAALIGLIAPLFAKLLLFAALPLLLFFETIVTLASRLDLPFTLPMNGFVVVGYYFLLLAIVLVGRGRERNK